MTSESEFGNISFDLPKNQSNVIKVIGVGGGGSNAINHMFKQGIKGVDFIVCNTDSQALQSSPVPNKIQLGQYLTEGLGAGANPEVGQQSAIESIADIEKMLDSNTKMIFITAGMGGGTGTGAAPVIAQLAKERDILTVGIVTIPFQFEGKVRTEQAILGVEKLRAQVDSLIVINNNKLREVYGNLGFKAGYSKSDEVLATASRGIAEVITHHYTQNIDLKDAKTVLANSGTAIMGSATASGENRAKAAIESALDSPLLNDNKIQGARNVLLLIVSGSNEITIDEIGEINDHIQNEAGHNANIIMGVGEDETLGDAVAVTIIATGFNIEQQNEIVNTEPKKIIHTLGDDQKLVRDLTIKQVEAFQLDNELVQDNSDKKVFDLNDEFPISKVTISENELTVMSEFIKNLDVTFEIVSPIKDIDFQITSPIVEKIDQKVVLQEENQITFLFEQPIANQEVPEISVNKQVNLEVEKIQENQIFFELSNETRNIKVNQPVHVVPITEVNQGGIVKYSLEHYMEIEEQLATSKPVEIIEEQVDEEMNFTMKQVDSKSDFESNFSSNNSPMEMSIDDSMKLASDERRKKLKEFNYKFKSAKLDEFEKIPAYKRSGIDLNNEPTSNQNSRISLGTDSNNDNQLRSNNSFLHDSVD
jgi:cell division protein FtsZ